VIPELKAIVKTYTVTEARTRFGEFIKSAQYEPVRVMRRNRVVGVMVSAHHYEAMRAFYADQFQRTLDRAQAETFHAGLTPEILINLLSNES